MAVGKDVPWEPGHPCGSCGRAGVDTASARALLSAYYGSWEQIGVDPATGARWLCLPCGAVLRDKGLRRMPAIVNRATGSLTRPSYAELRAVLSAALPRDVAVTVPIEGRKAVLASARWGTVATDAGCITWTSAHRAALATVVELTSFGFTEGLLSHPSPPFGVLSRAPIDQHARIRQLWSSLARWREDVAAWPLLVRLARRDKDAK